MDGAQLTATVRRVVQVTVATRVYAVLAAAVPSAFQRTAVAVGAAVLFAGGASTLRRAAPPSATVVADLSLAVATTALLRDVDVAGAHALPLRLAHCCMVLEAGQALAPLALGHLGDAFLGNVQYLFATALAGVLLAIRPAGLALIAAVALALVGGAGLRALGDPYLADGLVSAALSVGRTLLLASLPDALALPSLLAILSFARPLHVLLGLSDPVYDYALFIVGDALQTALEAALPPLTAMLAGVALVCVAPTPAVRAAAQIAALGAAVDLIVALIRPAADPDPILCLLPVLVFTRVVSAYLT